MSAIFPSFDWLVSLKEKLNSDEKYKQIASKWEGDIIFLITPGGALKEEIIYYVNLWHGECPGVAELNAVDEKEAVFILQAGYDNIVRILKGELNPMVAMMTRKLNVKGNLGYMLKNVPTVLYFVRCCQEVTDQIVGE
jgi:putative sterol carrier protein